jgi:hypothetical protein
MDFKKLNSFGSLLDKKTIVEFDSERRVLQNFALIPAPLVNDVE